MFVVGCFVCYLNTLKTPKLLKQLNHAGVEKI